MRRPYWSKKKLRKYQEKRIRFLVNHSYYNVSFYRKKFKELGITPNDIKTLEDLNKLPIIKKDELRKANTTDLISKGFSPSNLKKQKTSGSTGKPFTLYLNRAEDSWRKAIYMRANISCGQKIRDSWVVITAPHHFSDSSGIQRRLGFFAQTCVPVFTKLKEQVQIIKKVQPNVLDGYSGAIHLLAKEIDRQGIDSIRPRIVFGTADLIDDRSRNFIEDIFDAPFYDQFGCSEVDRTAWQCPEKIGYHMDIDSVITQFVDDDGNEVSSGERGNIVYTSLFNYVTPFIRYSVGDLGVPFDDECPCGRNFPLMKNIEGRSDSVLVLPNGELISPRMFTVAMGMFNEYPKIAQFKIVQEKVDLIDFYIHLKDDSMDRIEFQNSLLAHYKKIFGSLFDGVNLSVSFVNEIAAEKTGKRRAVISKVKR